MPLSPAFNPPDTQDDHAFRLTGDWCGAPVQPVGEALIREASALPEGTFDLHGVRRMDIAGAWAVLQALEPGGDRTRVRGKPEHLRLLDMVAAADAARPKRRAGPSPFRALLERIGRGVVGVGAETYGTLAFAGQLMVVTARSLANPSRIRWAPCISMAERAGLDALPIVVVANFFIFVFENASDNVQTCS